MPDIYVSSDKKKPKELTKSPLKKRRLRKVEAQIVSEETKKEGTRNPFSAFMVLPQALKFETQEEEEEVLFVLRKHVLTNVPWIFFAILMILAPFFLKYVPLLSFLPSRYQFISVVMWYLITTAMIFENFLSWYFNAYIITDERIIDIDFYSLIYKRISDAKIQKIQDITYRMGGAIRALFNFGSVFIQTAGEVPEFEFEDVPNPAQVAKILNRLVIQEEQEKLEGRVR